MKNKYIFQIKAFWIIYVILLSLFVLGSLIPKDSDIIWIWIWLFFMPFTFFVIYAYGFFLGIWIQNKLKNNIKEISFLAIVYFILHFLLYLLWGLKGFLLNGITHNIDRYFYPAFGSTLLFILGAFIAKWIYSGTPCQSMPSASNIRLIP